MLIKTNIQVVKKNYKSIIYNFIFLSAKIIFTYINTIRIILNIDSNKHIINFWKQRGKSQKISDVSIDGFGEIDKSSRKILDEIKNDIKAFILKNLKKNQVIMDYGCGTGRYIEYINNYGAFRITGIDISKNILNNFTQKKFKNNKNVKLVATDLSLDDSYVKKSINKFNKIYTISVIQYIRYKQLPILFNSFYKILKKDGLLYIAFPNPDTKWDLLYTLNYIRYYPTTIENYLTDVGFKITNSYSIHHKKKFAYLDNKKLKNYGYVIIAQKV